MTTRGYAMVQDSGLIKWTSNLHREVLLCTSGSTAHGAGWPMGATGRVSSHRKTRI